MANISYANGTSSIPLIGETIGKMLERISNSYPNNEALVSVDQNIRWTYSEFLEKVDEVALSLMAIGVNKGDRVGIWALNYAEWVVVQFASARCGAIMVNINPSYRTFELEYTLKQAEVHTLILQGRFKSSDYVGMLYEACPDVIESRAGKISTEKFPFLRNVVFLGNVPYNGMFAWDEFIGKGKNISPDELIERGDSLSFDEPINIQYTSGTTGYPKGVVLTHHNVLNNGYTIGNGMKFTEKDRLCIPVPFYHCFGMVLSNLACVTHGSTMVIPSPAFDPEAVLKTIDNEKCTAVHGVPTMFIAELKHPNFNKYKYDSLRTGIMAGSPCPVEIMKAVNQEMNMKDIVIVYGQTETSPGITMTTTKDPLEMRVSTVGQTFPHVEIKIIDPLTRKIVLRGEPGEICARGYVVMKCYYNNPSATMHTVDADGWNHTGDLGIMDEKGYIKIVGRLKEMVIRGGENIYPREIEEFLHTNPKILDAYVIGVPDENYGEELMVWVKLHEGFTMTGEELKEFCNGQIARYKIPKYVKFVEDFPMTVSGKIRKGEMREISIKELGLEEEAEIETA
ncbi:MAG: AMP-binding protein [Methanogenium sp.]|nr:AMP-binding protein [Methanogenium sp.]